MRFARLGALGAEIPVVVTDDGILDLRPLTDEIDAAFLADSPVERVGAAIAAGTLPELADAASRRIGAPIPRPSAVVCIGMNYAHAPLNRLTTVDNG